jgi:alkylhydroperoxidase/carboxymuconolactone decarboxylase family protein YurZ
MEKIFTIIFGVVSIAFMTGACASANQTVNAEYDVSNQLPLKKQKIAVIAALTASGDIPRLREVFVESLEAGLTVNEIKEVLIHTHAYAGFPRALNGINAFIAVMDEREAAGIEDTHGPEASPVPTTMSRFELGYNNLARLRNPNHVLGEEDPTPLPRYASFTPTIETFLKENLFGALFSRDVLDYLSRQIATVGVISNLPGANAQLRSHIGLTMVQGASEEQLRHLFIMMRAYIGKERSDNALAVLREAVNSRN